MLFEYILLACVFILPTIYKLWYWQSILASEDNDVKKFCNYLKTKQGSESILHFWILLEIPIFILSIIPLFNAPFEFFLYNVMLYFGFLYNIFVIGKILRKKMISPKVNTILIFTICLLILDGVASFLLNEKYLYIYLSWALLFMPLYFVVVIFVHKYWNTKFLRYHK